MSDTHMKITDHVATITLDRPSRLNAFTDSMEQELIDCMDVTDADASVRVVVLTGSGRAFCAGADLGSADVPATLARWRDSEDAPATHQDTPRISAIRPDGGGRVAMRIFESSKPIIAAINGAAIGVGITMTLPADFRIAARNTRIAFPFTRRGLIPESCSSWFLPRLVGMSTAADWILTGRTLYSEEGLAAGLFHSLQDAADVLPAALSLAREMADHTAPVCSSIARRLLWQMLTVDHPMAAHEVETAALNSRIGQPDTYEGVAAFLTHREPAFTESVTSDIDSIFDRLTPRDRWHD